MTKRSKAPSVCWPFITCPCKMTDKNPKTMEAGKRKNEAEKIKSKDPNISLKEKPDVGTGGGGGGG